MTAGENRRRFRNVSGKALDRRVIMKAAAGVGAMAAAGSFSAASVLPVAAQESTTIGNRFIPGEQGGDFTAAATGDWLTFTPDFAFTALGASWSGDVGTWPQIEVQLSSDGSNWSDTYLLTAQVEDGGPANRGGRIFTWLILTDGASIVRYRTLDGDYNPADIAELSFDYIDSSNGPTENDLTGFTASADDDTLVSPPIINRAAWGANESYRTWPPEYDTVQKVIIHHSATSNNVSDWAGAVRSIYYYHAVTQGWGDIGYNYLVSPTGKIYEGRYGGQDVVGGHAYEYAWGSSGICLMGDYSVKDITAAAESAIVAIAAWVARDLDPYGSGPFHEAPDLPTIASHRDVSSTTCPGDYLWNDLPEIRDLVASALDEGDLDTGNPGGMVIGDRVTVHTDDKAPLNVRNAANGTFLATVNDGSIGWIIDGPQSTSDANWYRVQFQSVTGWVTAQYLIVTPPAPPASDDTYYFGANIIINTDSWVRSGPTTTSNHIGDVKKNAIGFILDGPRVASNDTWYQVAFRDSDGPDGWVTKAVLTVAPININPDAKFNVPSWVVTTEQVNVRVRPGLAQTVQGVVPANTPFQLTVNPLGINGYIFYGAYGSFGGGWVIEDFLKTVSSPPTSSKFKTGDTVRVTAKLNLRQGASSSAKVVVEMAADTTATVVGGPTPNGSVIYWQLTTEAGETGWAAEQWLALSTGSTPGTPKFVLNDSVAVTESLNMRSAANTSGSVIAVLPANTAGTVIGGPSTGSGYTWYRVQTSLGTGWVVQDWLTKSSTTPGTPPPTGTGKFTNGQAIRVTDSLNLRSGAGTSNGVVAVLSAGTTGTVIGGPTVASGYTWWNIQTGSGSGWAAEDWLAANAGGTPGTPPPTGTGKFSNGQAIRVTESLNLRSGAGTSNGVVAVLSAGTTGTVIGGPTVAGGYTWWNIQTGSGSGWAAEDWLAANAGGTPGTPPPTTGGIATGDKVKVIDGTLNMRSAASLSGSIVAALPDATQLTVLSGPVSADGYLWYQVSGSYGTGWVAGVYIRKV